MKFYTLSLPLYFSTLLFCAEPNLSTEPAKPTVAQTTSTHSTPSKNFSTGKPPWLSEEPAAETPQASSTSTVTASASRVETDATFAAALAAADIPQVEEDDVFFKLFLTRDGCLAAAAPEFLEACAKAAEAKKQDSSE